MAAAKAKTNATEVIDEQIKNTNTASNAGIQKKVDLLKRKQHLLYEKYKNEKKVEVVGSPFYQPYFGGNMRICINGMPVYVPLDGQPHAIPETYANLFREKIARVDNLIQKQGSLAVTEESFAGEASVF